MQITSEQTNAFELCVATKSLWISPTSTDFDTDEKYSLIFLTDNWASGISKRAWKVPREWRSQTQGKAVLCLSSRMATSLALLSLRKMRDYNLSLYFPCIKWQITFCYWGAASSGKDTHSRCRSFGNAPNAQSYISLLFCHIQTIEMPEFRT